MPGLEDELGDVVRKARSGLGLDIADLARQVGMAESDLKGVEVYTRHPDEQQVRKLARALQLRPDQVWDLAEDTWSAPDGPWTIGEAFTVERLTNHYPEHCYVVTDREGNCLIVDPGAEEDRIIAAVQMSASGASHGKTPHGILITHFHQDHTGAVVPVQRATNAPVYVHEADRQGVNGVPAGAVTTVTSDGELRIGPFTVRVLHTPGHSAGSTTYVLTAGSATAAFCGDTLFAGSVGNARVGYDVILNSVRKKICALPDDTTLYPGHGPTTNVANEKQRNPFL